MRGRLFNDRGRQSPQASVQGILASLPACLPERPGSTTNHSRLLALSCTDIHTPLVSCALIHTASRRRAPHLAECDIWFFLAPLLRIGLFWPGGLQSVAQRFFVQRPPKPAKALSGRYVLSDGRYS